MKPFCITFAGPVGCSKTPLAHYLSINLGWPILSNDAFRSEIREDSREFEVSMDSFNDLMASRTDSLSSTLIILSMIAVKIGDGTDISKSLAKIPLVQF